jgi:D-alanine-D-alanine ligase
MRIAVLHNAVSAADSLEDQDVLVQVDVISQALRKLGHELAVVPCTLNLAAMQDDLARLQPDVVFNLVETLAGDDALAYLVPAVLDSMKLPYTGCTSVATFLTTHKLIAKERLLQAGLPTPAWITTTPLSLSGSGAGGEGQSDTPLSSYGRGAGGEGFADTAWIIKGVWEQASRNLDEDSIVTGVDEAALRTRLVEQAARLGRPCYAEQFIVGREFNIAVLDGPDGPEVLPPAEIDFSAFPEGKPRIVGYRAKWHADSFEFQNTPRRFEYPTADQPLLGQLRSLSLRCWELFDLRGYVRVDYRVDQSRQPWILEINTNPCLSPDAGFAAALQQAGIPFDEAIGRIVERAGT